MKKIDRMRERVSILPTSTYLSKMHDAGWTLIALEWEREVESSSAPEPEQLPAASEEIPLACALAPTAVTWKMIRSKCKRSASSPK